MHDHHPYFFFFSFHPIYYRRTTLAPLPVVTQIRGRIAGPLPPSPPRACLHFYHDILIQHLLPSSTRVELHLRTHAARRSLSSSFFFLHFCKYSESHHGGNRTQGLIMLKVFEGNHQTTGATGLHPLLSGLGPQYNTQHISTPISESETQAHKRPPN